jgi:outer membrane protein insertion porin family
MALRYAVWRAFVSVSAVCLMPLLQAADLASPATYEGKPISEIRFVPPSQPVMRDTLLRLVPFQPGTPLRLDEVRAAIKRLYGTGEFADIVVDTEASGSGVVLIIRTTEQYFVGAVEVHGKVKLPPNEGQLGNASRLELGTPFHEEDLAGAQKSMKDLLERNGLYLATIQPQLNRDPERQQVSFNFRVDSGKRARLTTPSIVGETRLTPEEVAKAAKYHGWFRWKLATEDNVQNGIYKIRTKYEKKDRLTAAVSLQKSEYLPDENRVRETIEANGGPKIKFETNGAKVKKSTLQKYVPVFDEETVNRDLLVTGVRNLRDYFQNKGYFDVTVDFQTRDEGPDQRVITFVVGLGDRHKVVDVEVQGNKVFSTSAIRERMFIQPKGFIRLRHGRYSDGFAKRDQEAIRALYRDNGYRDVKVTVTPNDDYQGKQGEVQVVMSIEEGPQYLVSNLTVNGVDRKDRDTILSLMSSKAGQPFSDSSVSIDRDYLLNLYQSTGYPDVNFDYRVAPGPGPNQMQVFYTVTEGQPRYVRDVLITGMRSTRMRLVRPNVLLKAGDPLSWTEMGNMQRRLYDLGVFDKVDMAIQNPNGDIQNKYILYHLTEGHRWYTAIGLGGELARIGGSQTSLNSPSGATGFAPRGSLEVSRLNLWGLGHSINFKGRYSTLDRRLSLNYLAPRYRNVDGRNISFTALYDNTRDVLTFTARRLEGSMQYSQKLSKPTTVMVRYSWRDVRIDPGTLKINPGLIPLYSQNAHVALIGGNLVQDRRDDPANAHRGIYNTIDAAIAEKYLGGNTNFFRFLARNSYYKTVATEWVIASNTEFGWIHPFSPQGSADAFIPLAERFFGGGSTSHRGFPDNQAGPRDVDTGFPIGGDALFFHATELRFPFLGENMNGVFFHDMGNIYSGLDKLSFRVHQNGLQDFDYMVHAAGFGIRYKTPVGPVRVDLAYSINPPTFHGLTGSYQDLLTGHATATTTSISHFQFFFSIGQAF